MQHAIIIMNNKTIVSRLMFGFIFLFFGIRGSKEKQLFFWSNPFCWANNLVKLVFLSFLRHATEYPRDKVILHQYVRGPYVPSTSPFVVKLETYCRMAKIPYLVTCHIFCWDYIFVCFVVGRFGWLVVLRINVDLAIFQPYLDLKAGDNQSLKIQVARLGIEPRSSCSASQELNHSATAAPSLLVEVTFDDLCDGALKA